MILKNIFVLNVQINMDLRFVSENKSFIKKKNQRFFFKVKQRKNKHRRDYSDANADNKVCPKKIELIEFLSYRQHNLVHKILLIN
jgi:hypothetical protein